MASLTAAEHLQYGLYDFGALWAIDLAPTMNTGVFNYSSNFYVSSVYALNYLSNLTGTYTTVTSLLSALTISAWSNLRSLATPDFSKA